MHFTRLLVAVAIAAAPALALAADAAPSMKIRARLKEGTEKEYPTRVLDDLKDFQPAQAQLDHFGGWASGEKQKATGYFYARKIGPRWWLIDPEGNRFLHIAVNSVSPGAVNKSTSQVARPPTAAAAFPTKFGTFAQWWAQTANVLRKTGFNGTGSWSADEYNTGSDRRRLVYTPQLSLMAGYGRQRGGTFAQPGHTGYPQDCIFAFDPAFETYCDEQCKKLAEKKDDPWLLGYFSDNEMPFPEDLLDKALKLPKDDPTFKAAYAFTQQRLGNDRHELTKDDREAWRGVVADKYFATVNRAIKKYDPNHLYLGARFHASEKRSQAVLAAAGKHVDVVSVNVYQVWTPTREMIGRWADWSGKPVLVTEWYAKGDDTGLPNKTGAGWTVATQADRGWFYQNFTLGLLESQACVGWHWFKYMDNDPTDTQAELSNRDSNKGIVTASYQPHTPLLDRMKTLNEAAYPLTAYFDQK